MSKYKWTIVVYGDNESELNKAIAEIKKADPTAVFDYPKERLSVVSAGDEDVVTSRRVLPVGTKYFVVKTLHILELEPSIEAKVSMVFG